VGLIQSVEGLKRKKTNSPKEEGILPADSLWTQTATSAPPCVSSLPTLAANFGLASLHSHTSQFLKISFSLFLPIHMHVCVCTHIHIPWLLLLWKTLTGCFRNLPLALPVTIAFTSQVMESIRNSVSFYETIGLKFHLPSGLLYLLHRE
jgi:hypothetical protein